MNFNYKKNPKFVHNLLKGMLIIVIAMIVSAFLLFLSTIGFLEKHAYQAESFGKGELVLICLIFLITFLFFSLMIYASIRYNKEFFGTKQSAEYKRLENMDSILGFIILSLILIFGLVEVFVYDNVSGWSCVMVAVGMIITSLHLFKRENEKKNRK